MPMLDWTLLGAFSQLLHTGLWVIGLFLLSYVLGRMVYSAVGRPLFRRLGAKRSTSKAVVTAESVKESA